MPAHPAIVSGEVFTAAQLLRRRTSAGGLATARKSERGKQRERRTYVLRGLVRCGVCQRKMSGEMVRKNAYYRCAARTLAPGSAALADHPITVNLREDVMVDALNRWIGRLFDRENIDQTVTQLLGSHPTGAASSDVAAAKARRADAERRLRRFQDAIAAGADLAAVVEPMNQAQAERASAQAEIDAAPKQGVALDVAEVYAMIDSLGDVGATLADAKPPMATRAVGSLSSISAPSRTRSASADVPRGSQAQARDSSLGTNRARPRPISPATVPTRRSNRTRPAPLAVFSGIHSNNATWYWRSRYPRVDSAASMSRARCEEHLGAGHPDRVLSQQPAVPLVQVRGDDLPGHLVDGVEAQLQHQAGRLRGHGAVVLLPRQLLETPRQVARV
jgi:Recombinase zinc beta ribbon domain